MQRSLAAARRAASRSNLSFSRICRRCAYSTNSTPDTLTRVIPVLQHVHSLVGRVLPPTSEARVRYDTLTRWALNEATGLIEQPRTRPVRVGVIELDSAARATDVVSALLDDPFSSDDDARRILHERWKKTQLGTSQLLLRNGERPAQDDGGVVFPSSWLRRTNAEVLELARHDDASVLDLFHADIPVVVVSGLDFATVPLLSALELHPTARIVVNSPMCSSDYGHDLLARRMRDVGTLSRHDQSRIHWIDAHSALRALEFIRDTRDPRAVQNFQEHYLNSRVARLVDGLEEDIDVAPRERTAGIALFVAQATVRECRAALTLERGNLDLVKTTATLLQTAIDAQQSTLTESILGKQGAVVVADEVARAEGVLRDVMKSLQWWQVPLNVDDVGYIVRRAVDGAYCTELEKKLAFYAGHLQAVKSAFDVQTADALAGTPAEFKSQLLANELDQLRLLPSGSITPATLTTPIVSRRELVAAPTTFLHRRAQQLVFSATSTMFLSGVGSYSAWAWQLLDATTSAGLGVLISVATLRWAIARWEKAQKRWWEDWQRIGQGLARDVQREFVRCLGERVFLVPQRLCDRLTEGVERRSRVIEQVEAELQRAEREVDGLASRPQERAN